MTKPKTHASNADPINAKRKHFHSKYFVMVIMSIILASMGAAAKGEFVLYLVILMRSCQSYFPKLQTNSTNISSTGQVSPLNEYLGYYSLQDLFYYIGVSMVTSYAVFISVGGFLQWNYYYKKRSIPETWKCQPKRFLTVENELHEIMLGSFCLMIGATISGTLTAYIANGGRRAKIYYNISDFGIIYFVASTVVLFLFLDAASYYYHRALHHPFLYRNFHKWHHRYHSPTAFSAVAMHPVESTIFQLILISPMFVVPLHFVSVIGVSYYLYYFGLIDHSGVDLESIYPWQPPVKFHDDHHKLFHVNFGFNTTLFDRFHDTIRKDGRRYGEDVFGGKGK